ncbi:translation elongation factor Ts [Streptomyces sp. NPDC050315]|uniref:translation elongation factor Ts n=1 Tax=Streptomyces sp. NPDC050315 TaxID=3155039 RepID=UPI003445D4E6
MTTAESIKEVRARTGAKPVDCRKALLQTNGNVERAVELLGGKVVFKAQGLVVMHSAGPGEGALFELNCETDFITHDKSVVDLAQRLVRFAVDSAVADTSALLAAEIEPGTTVRALIDQNAARVGETLEAGRYARLKGTCVSSYLGGNRVGVLVQLQPRGQEKIDEVTAKNIAAHIAEAKPEYITRDEVPAEEIEQLREFTEGKARLEDKPETAIPKLVEEQVNAHYRNRVLVEQEFITDPTKTVGTLLDSAQITVERFIRFAVGE